MRPLKDKRILKKKISGTKGPRTIREKHSPRIRRKEKNYQVHEKDLRTEGRAGRYTRR